MSNLRLPLSYACAMLLAPLAVAAQQGEPTHAGGEVMFISGQAQRLNAAGAAQFVAKGMTLFEGDTIKTAADSHVYVRLRDGGLLVVRPASQLHIDLWRYDPARPQDSAIKYTLDNGVARHVSGAGVKAARDKFRFNTPMAAIGVRGTDFTVLADATVTRISVQSGGVIVNSFGNGCQAAGLGPCEGSSAVELFASSRAKLLEVRAGERHPELIDDATAAPDHHRPAAAAEPTARGKTPVDADVVAELRTGELVAAAERAATAPPPAIPAAAVPPAEPPPPPTAAPEPPNPAITIAAWGRWASAAGLDSAPIDLEQLLKGRSLVGVNAYGALAANPSATPMELPGSGIGSFKLLGHEGFITDTVTQASVASRASDASLKIDFGTRKFETSMTVSAGAVSIPIKGMGDVESNGRFASAAFTSPAVIQGLVGGSQTGEAVYLYYRSVKGYDAAGVASWLK